MARRRLEAPSPETLRELSEGFARETSPAPGLGGPGNIRPPIAQIAAEAAALSDPLPATDRASRAKDAADAGRVRVAEAAGRLVLDLPLTEIVADELARDRAALDPEALAELRNSIAMSGQRLPIEVFELTDPEGAERWGLLSGWRRLTALRQLHADTGDARFATVRALVREPGSVANAYAAMVEENEIRAELSQYERGRIAVLTVDRGVFPSVDAAVNALFLNASRAKRSKIRSFAQIHEELGDMLAFPAALSERAGLRVAQALRFGYGSELREALASGVAVDAAQEWALMEPFVILAEDKPDRDPARGGRPRGNTPPRKRVVEGEIRLANGIAMRCESDSRGWAIRFSGPVNAEMLDAVMAEVERLLEAI